jgi:acetylglutamate kinase
MVKQSNNGTTPESNPIVVKISGTLLADGGAPEAFWRGMRTLQETAPVVLVHGGGAQATAMARRLGHEPTIVQGRRVTGDLDLDIVHWVLRGKLNTQLVADAKQHGLTAVGLSGADGTTLRVTKRPPWTVDGEAVDFGWVGDVEGVDPALLRGVLAGGMVPVVAPLGIDAEGQTYNVNADTVARALAAALGAEELLLVTATGGVRRQADVPDSHLATCTADTFEQGTEAGWINGGMRVKMEVAFDALSGGVSDVYICAPDDLVRRAHATRVVG